MNAETSHVPELEVATMNNTNTTAPTSSMAGETVPHMGQNDKAAAPDVHQTPTRPVKSRQAPNQDRVKIKHARSRILLLVACLAYIVTVFTTLSMGLNDISAYLEPRLDNARIESNAKGSLRYREQMLYSQLNKLLDTRLRWGFRESYEECLARGLQDANEKFFGLGFQYPDIREQTMEWTTDNCKRLQYTPQTVQSTPQQTILTRWARTTHRARRIVEKTFDVMASAYTRLLKVFRVTSLKPGMKSKTKEDSDIHETPASRPPPEMPFGFKLDCASGHPCGLTYLTTAGVPDKASISHDDIIESIQRVDGLSKFCAKLDSIRSAMAFLALEFLGPEIFSLLAYFVAAIYLSINAPSKTPKKPAPPKNNSASRFSAEERYAAGSMLLQLFTTVAHTIAKRASRQASKVTLIEGLILVMVGISMMINFFIPIMPQLENYFQMTEIITELYGMLKDQDVEPVPVPPMANETISASVAATADTSGAQGADNAPQNPVSSASSSRKSSSVGRSNSLETTVQEDVRDELDAIREEQNHQAYVETDSDDEFDGERFVDLAGGITPTISNETDSDCAVVDA